MSGFIESGERVAVVGSMGFVGKGVVKLLKEENIQLIELDKRKGDTKSQIKQGVLSADLVVSATGRENLIQPDYLKPEHKLVIDAAFIPREDGRILGDISQAAYDIPLYLTPVPGGVGPTQMAVLLERIFKVAEIEIQPWDYQRDILRPLQQERVAKIAPLLLTYLELNQTLKIDKSNLLVEYRPELETIIYQDKVNPDQKLKAQRQEDKWVDLGSNISAEKESYFLSEAAPTIEQVLQDNRENINKSNNRGRTGKGL